MSWSERNAGKRWTPSEKRELGRLASGNTPTRVAGFKLGRSEEAIRSMASELSISLNPPNRSPYGKR